MRHLSAAILLAASAAPAIAAPAGYPATATAIVRQGAGADGPGISAIISENGRILFAGAAGKADLGTKAPLTPDSLFRYASITKQFTAALILTLADDGRLSLDDTVGKLLPTETPTAWHPVTIRQLLNHTSGIPNYTDQPENFTEAKTAARITTQGLIDLTRDKPLNFAPGTSWRYNNTGYVLLSAITEKLTGKPWYVALRERITGPLRLSSIRCGCEPGPTTVAGYSAGGAIPQKIDMTVPSGAGALVGNARDLLRWMEALHGGKVLKPVTYQAMITPLGAAASAPMRYGFGLARSEVRGVPGIEHGGDIFGFATDSVYLPSRKLAAVVLGNGERNVNDPQTTSRRLLAAAAGLAYPAMQARPADLAALAPYFGSYRWPNDVERRFFAVEGKLYVQRAGGSRLEVFAAGGDRYFYGPSSLTFFDLVRDKDGKPAMRFHARGALEGEVGGWGGPMPAETAAVTLSDAERAALAGDYAAGPMVMTIVATSTGLTGQLTGQRPIPLEAIGKRELRTVGVDARMVFDEKNGKIVRVVLHQGGQTIPFERR